MFKKKYVINRNVESLDILRESLNADMETYGFNHELISHFELCIYEIIINIIEHSKLPEDCNPDTILRVFEKNGDLISEIIYYAEKFDYTAKKMPDIETHFKSGHDRGLGVYIIRTLMEKFSYSFRKYRNKIIISKKII
ncbi:MAG: ATP-binding protein [Spirochaetes bacterium]|nr:ATP-binding protein [Spirochaetota bacterium]